MSDVIGADIKVRPVTAEEVDFFFENGWVHVPGLISPQAAASLRERGEREFGTDGRAGLDPALFESDAPNIPYRSWSRSISNPFDDPEVAPLARSPELGRNAARLLGRDSPIRLTTSSLGAKLPGGGELGRPTDYHQDIPGHMYFTGNFLTAWVALVEITPDMGPMRFHTGSHKLGALGRYPGRGVWDGLAPRFKESCPLTDPINYQAGDATFHAAGTVHGTDVNATSRPRWSWAGVLIPGDATFTGAQYDYIDTSRLEVGDQLDATGFPVIYRPG